MEKRKRWKIKSFTPSLRKEKRLLLNTEQLNSNKHKKVLVLGMVYIDDNIKNNLSIAFGQEKRDLIRILGLIKLGYEVFSMDDKHSPINGKHCNANFNNSRKMFKSMVTQQAYPINLRADYIILDYFFSLVCLMIIIFEYSRNISKVLYFISILIFIRRAGICFVGVRHLFQTHL